MAQTYSFDITSGCELQEVDNAVNQSRKELENRYDFRGVLFEIDFRRQENCIVLQAPDELKVNAIYDVLLTKLVKRGVPVRNLDRGKLEDAAGGTVRQIIDLVQGIPGDKAREIVKIIKEKKLKKVQASIQGDQVRVTAPSKDDLQLAIGVLRKEDFGLELEFGNYR